MAVKQKPPTPREEWDAYLEGTCPVCGSPMRIKGLMDNECSQRGCGYTINWHASFDLRKKFSHD